MNKKVSIIWTITLLIFVGFLLYQTRYSWNENFSEPASIDTLPEDETVFLIFQDKHYGVMRSGFDSLMDSLEMWEFDKKEEKVKIKYDSLLPSPKTQLTILYDRGYDSFEKHADVLPLAAFPYEYYYKNEPLFKIHAINKEGDVYIEYKEKRIHLPAGKSYHTVVFQGYKMTTTTITNYGIYKKSQFKLMAIENKKDELNEILKKEEITLNEKVLEKIAINLIAKAKLENKSEKTPDDKKQIKNLDKQWKTVLKDNLKSGNVDILIKKINENENKDKEDKKDKEENKKTN